MLGAGLISRSDRIEFVSMLHGVPEEAEGLESIRDMSLAVDVEDVTERWVVHRVSQHCEECQ